MPPLQNDTFLRTLLREPTAQRPVWIMRQAGRYLPEYRAVRAEAGDFMTMCRNPELACEVTLQPLRRFALDASIIFSDILTIPDAMGLGLYFVTGEGPRFERPLQTVRDIEAVAGTDAAAELGYVYDAVNLTRREIGGKVPLIGFSGSPWTLMTYMVEGGSSKNFSKAKGMLYNEPAAAHKLLDTLARTTIDYLNAQTAAGAQALMIFDTWGGVLTPHQYREFSLDYMRQIVAGLKRENEGRTVPVILFTKGAARRLTDMTDAGADALGVDWTISLAEARRWTQGKVALQGNLDPCLLYGQPEAIREEVRRCLESYGTDPGHVVNLGHGINPDVDPEHLGVLVDAVHEFSAAQLGEAAPA
ncbi:MAG: uroporphyrinogen decarboxylase [Pseudomonadota bacterium]